MRHIIDALKAKLFSPSTPVPENDYERGYAQAEERLKEGFGVELLESSMGKAMCLETSHPEILAQTFEERGIKDPQQFRVGFKARLDVEKNNRFGDLRP